MSAGFFFTSIKLKGDAVWVGEDNFGFVSVICEMSKKFKSLLLMQFVGRLSAEYIRLYISVECQEISQYQIQFSCFMKIK